MDIKNYLIVNTQSKIVENIVLWNGDTNSWLPPDNCIAMAQDTTPAKIWSYSQDTNSFELIVVIGEGQIGFSWDGEFVVTNQQPPQIN